MDADSEIQWKALSKFETDTFCEFKMQVIASYPKAEDVESGSISALEKRKIHGLRPVAMGDHELLV